MNKTSKERRYFEDVVAGIVSAEKDVDKILEAARLDRHESAQFRLTGEQKYAILTTAIGVFGAAGFFLGFVYLLVR